jgi:hypothetical protein
MKLAMLAAALLQAGLASTMTFQVKRELPQAAQGLESDLATQVE